MRRVNYRWSLVVFAVAGIGQVLPASLFAQEHQQSVSQSSEYAPPLNPPDLGDISVFLKQLEKLDIEIASFESQQATSLPVVAPTSPTVMSPEIAPQTIPPLEIPPLTPAEIPVVIKTQPTVETAVPAVQTLVKPVKRELRPSSASRTQEVSTATTVPERLVLNIKGTGTESLRQVPDETGMTTGYMDARCYKTDVFDAQTGARAGVVEQCLSEIASGEATPSLSGKQIIETTIFNLDEGRLVVQELSTMQPLNWNDLVGADDDQFTHVTASRSSSNALIQSDEGPLSTTGIFKRQKVKLRSSGMIDLSREQDGEVSMDSIVVLEFFPD